MASDSIVRVNIVKVSALENDNHSAAFSEVNDFIAAEEPLEIRIVYGDENNRQEKNISVTMCTPGNEEELATGFLFTEGIIKSVSDILHCSSPDNNLVIISLKPGIEFDPQKLDRHFYTSSSCGVCGKSSIGLVKNKINYQSPVEEFQVKSSVLNKLPETLRKQQNVFENTGGLHACAIFDLKGELLFSREDVGRHNALDKLIGAALNADIMPLSKHVLLLSGRASFELIQKAAMAGIKIVCAIGAPSSLAVEMAIECDITLIGFLRNERFNIYSGKHRVVN